jgi:hypothetical protein
MHGWNDCSTWPKWPQKRMLFNFNKEFKQKVKDAIILQLGQPILANVFILLEHINITWRRNMWLQLGLVRITCKSSQHYWLNNHMATPIRPHHKRPSGLNRN